VGDGDEEAGPLGQSVLLVDANPIEVGRIGFQCTEQGHRLPIRQRHNEVGLGLTTLTVWLDQSLGRSEKRRPDKTPVRMRTNDEPGSGTIGARGPAIAVFT
jgi:hypothetical protein